MNTPEIIALAKEILAEESSQVSGPSDRYWSDAFLLRHLNTAHREFAVTTLSLVDESTPDITQIILRDSVPEYKLHPSIIGVTHVYLPGYGDLIEKTRTEIMAQSSQVPGTPGYYYADSFTKILRIAVLPSGPSVGRPLQLRVTRLPLCALTMSDSSRPEILEQWHEVLAEFVVFRALMKHDADTENISKAAAHKQIFDSTCNSVRDMLKTQSASAKAFEAPPGWDFP